MKLVIGEKYVVGATECELVNIQPIVRCVYVGNELLETVVKHECLMNADDGFAKTVSSSELKEPQKKCGNGMTTGQAVAIMGEAIENWKQEWDTSEETKKELDEALELVRIALSEVKND